MALSLRANTNANCGLLSRLKSLINLQRFNHTLVEEKSHAQFFPGMTSDSLAHLGHIDESKWKKVDSRRLGITQSMISPSSLTVLRILRREGFEAYLVGGCVRDLILNKIPKDFDVITTANLKQIKKQFYRAMIVGRRFPICMVHVKGFVIEVSSFDTVAQHGEEKEKFLYSQLPRGCDEKDFIRWRNSMHRDFTVNSLFYDPFVNKIYDYANGIEDLRSLKLQTLIPAQLSFKEDCARILRGLRIAARLGLSLSKDTDTAIRKLSSSVESLAKARIMMEMNYMLSYGAAEPSLCLLQRFNLLEILLPFHAAYLDQRASKRPAQSSNMLMKLFFHLDRLVACDRPSDCSLWVGLLAFHLALVNNPQEALVVWAFASVLYHGNWEEGIKFAKEHAQVHVNFAPEISESSDFKSDEELTKGVTRLASLVQGSIPVLTDIDSLFRLMSRCSSSPCSGLVFISKKTGKDVAEIFQGLLDDVEYDSGRESFEIDYKLLGKGYLREIRFVLGKVILETLSGEVVKGGLEVVEVEKTHLRSDVSEDHGHPLSDLIKHQVLMDGKRKHGLSTFDPELKQAMVKKQKLVEKKSSLSKLELATMKQVLAKKEECQETHQLSQEEMNTMQGIILEKENHHLLEQEVTVEMQETVENEKCQDISKRHLKVVEKVKHQLSKDKVTKKHLKVVERCNLSQETKVKQKKESEKKDLHISPQQMVKEKHEVLNKKKGNQPLLSKIFK